MSGQVSHAEKKERYRSITAAMTVLFRETKKGEEVLLQLRQNTNYMDGYWDFSSAGHVDQDETTTTAACRETMEEVGVKVDPEDLEFICLVHCGSPEGGRYNCYFRTFKWSGEPTIKEPDKCLEIKWFPIDELPENLIDNRREALNNLRKGIGFSEMNW